MSICPRVLTTLIPVSHLGSRGGSSPSNTDSSVFFSHPSLQLNEKYTHTGLLNTKLLEKKSLNVIKVQSANKLHGSLHPHNHLNRISQHFKIIIGKFETPNVSLYLSTESTLGLFEVH